MFWNKKKSPKAEEELKDDRTLIEVDSMDEIDEDDPRIKIKILSPGYDPKEALMLLLHTDPSLDIQEIEEVYYPYIRFRYLIRVGKGERIEKLNKILDCSVDRVTGSQYEAKGIPEFEERYVFREDMLDIQIPIVDCYKEAHDFAMKMYISKGKLMAVPEFQIIEEEEFFKLYYVVNCLDKNELPYDILVDALDGSMTVLDSEYHLDLVEKSRNLLAQEEAAKLAAAGEEGAAAPSQDEPVTITAEEVLSAAELEGVEVIGDPEDAPEGSTDRADETEEVVEFIDVEIIEEDPAGREKQ